MMKKITFLKHKKKHEPASEPPERPATVSGPPLDRCPDLVTHLQKIERELPVGGTYTAFASITRSQTSSIGDILDAFYNPHRKTRHSLANVMREYVHDDVSVGPIQQVVRRYFHTLEYIDARGFNLSETYFPHVLWMLRQLGLTDLEIQNIYVDKPHSRFYVTLVKPEMNSLPVPFIQEDVSEAIVYSDRKTGSTALFEGLFKSGEFPTAVHLHNAHEFFEQRAHRIQDRIARSKACFPKVYIVNSFRDPIERKISEFFHLTKPTSADGLQENFEAFVRDYYAPPALREIMQMLGIGFGDLQKHEKYCTCEVDNVMLIILKHKYASDWSEILSTVMARDVKKIKQSNVTQSKLYARFKQECVVPEHFRIAAMHSEESIQLS